MRTLRSIRYFLLALVILAIPATAHAQFSASITVAPPELVVYSQPICPQEGYLWTPGYWGYGDEGYFWVPGTWVEPPSDGLLWTPGYWGWGNGGYAWNGGYWGPEVGFYGGVNYGFRLRRQRVRRRLLAQQSFQLQHLREQCRWRAFPQHL